MVIIHWGDPPSSSLYIWNQAPRQANISLDPWFHIYRELEDEGIILNNFHIKTLLQDVVCYMYPSEPWTARNFPQKICFCFGGFKLDHKSSQLIEIASLRYLRCLGKK